VSKIREQEFVLSDALPDPTPDTRHWVVYTSKRAGAPHKWAGYVDAPDTELALQFAREHYGLDEVCVGILAHEHKDAVDGEYALEPLDRGDASGQDGPEWTVFTLERRGGTHQTIGVVNAPDAATAIDRGRGLFAGKRVRSLRVVPSDKIHTTTAEELTIWRLHDMEYKLAKGYSKIVRTKWTKIRDELTYEEYQQDDIVTHF
jgi:1,2-phenylacetyl-CoA epoxidase PaaB subunit